MKMLRGCAITIITALALSAACPAQSAENAAGSVKQKLIGAWRLAWIDEQAGDGKMKHITDRRGTLLYTQDGHMSVQIMLPSAQPAPESNPVKYDQAGYEAYFGTYDVDEQAHTVTHHVAGSLVRALVGKNLTRVYRFSDGQLVLKSARPDEHWTIAWEHY
jgi:lipocalin-like protein